jgi:hypothetical protein
VLWVRSRGCGRTELQGRYCSGSGERVTCNALDGSGLLSAGVTSAQ